MKTSIQKILIPIDFSETSFLAIDHAAFMAKLFRADLTLLHVVEKTWEQFSVIQPELVVPPPSGFVEKIQEKLSDIAKNISKQYGIETNAICVEGNIFSEVVSFVNDNAINMVVMGTHGVSGFEEFFIGSNTYKVVTQSPCPVLSVQTHAKKIGFNDIVLPIDNSFHSRGKVVNAIEIAKNYGSKIHIAGLALEDMDEVELNKFELKLDQVQEFIEKNNIAFSRTTLKGENQAELTMEYAKKVDGDLIIIMTDQDSSGFFIGPYAQQVVNHSKVPVISVRPKEGRFDFPDLSGGYHAY